MSSGAPTTCLRPNIIAQEGPIAQGCVSWLWYKHDQLLVAFECGGRAKSGLILPITKVEVGETKIIAAMRTFTESYSWQALFHLPLRLNISSSDRASRHSSYSVLFYDLFHINLRQSNSAMRTSTFCLKTEWRESNTVNICVALPILSFLSTCQYQGCHLLVLRS